MVFKQFIAVVALGMMAPVGLAAGAPQQEPVRPQPRDQHVQTRYNIFVMEGVLERAVKHGADQLRRQVRRVMPDMLFVGGEAQARGFRLEGYGVFFDVSVPMMRQSVAWTLRTMMHDNTAATGAALQQIRAAIERTISDTREKANLMQAIKRLEIQVAAPLAAASAPAVAPRPVDRSTVTALDTPPEPAQPPPALTPEETTLLEDPNAAYEREVIGALVDAMLEHSSPIRLAAEEWLTIAAHDNEQRNRLMPGDPYDLLTIVLRVKGSDLAAYRAGRLTLEEARKRVLVSEF